MQSVEHASTVDADELEYRLFDFAMAIVKLVDTFPQSLSGRHIAMQLLRAGTTAVTRYADAAAARRDEDVVTNMEATLKEMRETCFWLRVVNETGLKSNLTSRQLMQDAESLYEHLGAKLQK